MTESNRVRVFLSYAKEDLDKVRIVYEGLEKRELNVWFDDKHLLPGAWKPQIENAIIKSRYFVICISEAALRKTGDERPGFQDEELNRAYNIAEKQPDKDFAIVPVRIEECGRGDFRLSCFHQYDLFEDIEKGLDKLAVHLGGSSLSDITAKDERTEDEKIIEHLMCKDQAAYFAAEYEKSIAILNSVLALKPDFSDALNNLGLVWSAKGEYDKAIECFEKSLKFGIKTFGEEHPNVAIC
ncbi:MAG: TIR domain-containing protein [Candidatus Scalindua sp.]|nr:TIR domain-containing protein [Candidatus Scalindua sp.]